MRRLLSLEGVRYAALLALLVVLLGGAAYASVESDQHLNAWDGIWWAINTVTTVGTGGTPHTTEGRIIAITVMVVGIGFVALLTAFIAERFIRRTEEEAIHEHEHDVLTELRRINERLDRLERRG